MLYNKLGKRNAELIEKYRQGTLTEEEKALFELEKKSNPDFAMEVETQNFLKEEMNYIQFKKVLKQVEQELEEEGFFEQFKPGTPQYEEREKKEREEELMGIPKPGSPEYEERIKNGLRTGILSNCLPNDDLSKRQVVTKYCFFRRKLFIYLSSVAAVILILLMVYLFNGNSYSGQELFNKYYITYDETPVVRDGNIETNIVFKEAIRNYENQNFKKASELFDELKRDNDKNPANNFYCAISNIELKNYDRAISLLNQVIVHEKNLFVIQSQWYLAMCHLAKNDLAKSKILLTALVNTNSSYKIKAKELLKKLE